MSRLHAGWMPFGLVETTTLGDTRGVGMRTRDGARFVEHYAHEILLGDELAGSWTHTDVVGVVTSRTEIEVEHTRQRTSLTTFATGEPVEVPADEVFWVLEVAANEITVGAYRTKVYWRAGKLVTPDGQDIAEWAIWATSHADVIDTVTLDDPTMTSLGLIGAGLVEANNPTPAGWTRAARLERAKIREARDAYFKDAPSAGGAILRIGIGIGVAIAGAIVLVIAVALLAAHGGN